jgi:3-hydroxyisobutyrate dehydrogenase-like beta-hydroxyacid dehydrogenase
MASDVWQISPGLIDSPVSGGKSGAENGTLTMDVGCFAAEVFRRHGFLRPDFVAPLHPLWGN